LHQIHNSSPYREQQRRQDDGVRVVFAKNWTMKNSFTVDIILHILTLVFLSF
jgi:hypothetical protein